MSDPKNEDQMGVGEMADGSINVMTEEEAIKSEIESLAEEKAFKSLLNKDDLDLDSMSVEELEKLLGDLDEGPEKG